MNSQKIQINDSKHVSLGNRLAAYYGLYYYETCDDPKYQWHLIATVGKVNYVVRMRLPNPNFEYTDSTILVNFTDGTAAPPIRGVNVFSNWDLIAHAQKKEGKGKSGNAGAQQTMTPTIVSKLSAWAGTWETDWSDDVYPKGGLKQQLRLGRSKVTMLENVVMLDMWVEPLKQHGFEGRMHDREKKVKNHAGQEKLQGDLMFGWTAPAALFLPPHTAAPYRLIKSEYKLKTAVPTWAYQPWPTWAEADSWRLFSHTNYNNGTGKKGMVPFVIHLERAPKLSAMQRWALKQTLTEADLVANNGQALYNDRTDGVKPETTTAQTENKPKLATPDPEPAESAPDAGSAAEQVEGDKQTSKESIDGAKDVMMKVDAIGVDEFPRYLLHDNPNAEELYEDITVDRSKDDGAVVNTVLNKLPATALPSGSLQRNGGNFHFFSARYQPWPTEDCYIKPRVGWVHTPMSETEASEHQERYGNFSNMLLRSTKPAKLELSKDQEALRIGTPKKVRDFMAESGLEYEGEHADRFLLDLPILLEGNYPSELKKLFDKHLRTILSIYWDDSGRLGSAHHITSNQKRESMLSGDVPVPGSKTETVEFPRVFLTEPPEDTVWTNDGKLWTGKGDAQYRHSKRKKEDRKNIEAGYTTFLNAKIPAGVESDMTVLEWLQTPWHFEYLPYQSMSSVFREGETYCAGCSRCSRPFFEYEHWYAPYKTLDTVNGTHKSCLHWPHMYWSKGTGTPQPFHDPQFWPKERLQKLYKTPRLNQPMLKADGSSPEFGDGHMDWPVYNFMLGFDEKQPTTDGRYKRLTTCVKGKPNLPNNENKISGILCQEWIDRVEKGRKSESRKKGEVPLLHNLMSHYCEDDAPWRFRQYINHMYMPEIWGAEEVKEKVKKNGKVTTKKVMKLQGYPDIQQGVRRTNATKIKFGVTDYKLMRSIKYGNVCRDCMATLDLAPGLYQRTGAVHAPQSLLESGQLRAGAVRPDTWWLALSGADVAMPDGTSLKFDPWFLYIHTSGGKRGTFYNGGQNHYKPGKSREMTYEQLIKGNKKYDVPGRVEQLASLASHDQRYAVVFANYKYTLDEMVDAHIQAVQSYVKARSCTLSGPSKMAVGYRSEKAKRRREQLKEATGLRTKLSTPPRVYIQKFWEQRSDSWKQRDSDQIIKCAKQIQDMIKWLDSVYVRTEHEGVPPSEQVVTKQAPKSKLELRPEDVVEFNRAMRDVLHDTQWMIAHSMAFDREEAPATFDPNRVRTEERDVTVGDVRNCLVISQQFTPDMYKREWTDVGKEPTGTVIKGKEMHGVFTPSDDSDWKGDRYVQRLKGDSYTDAKTQQLRCIQSKFFITYSLHRRVFSEVEARAVLEKMADAIRTLFGNDEELCKIVLFGHRLAPAYATDALGGFMYKIIDRPNKTHSVHDDTKEIWYGDNSDNTYNYDTYETHVESVDVDAGCEIGPTYHHPHFHCMLSLVHYSYVQIDKYRMEAVLESMFKGLSHGGHFYLIDGGGRPFYTDNEKPYVDIHIAPSDNVQDVYAAYVRKGADSATFKALRAITHT